MILTLRFLLFDADYTLLDFPADMRVAFRTAYRAMGFDAVRPFSDEVLALYESCNNRWWANYEKGLCDKETLYTRFQDFFRAAGLPARDPVEMNRVYFEALGRSGTPYPGALDLLRALSKRFTIYIVTNGNAATQKTRFAQSGILDFVQGVFISDEVGYAKPDKRFFDAVLSGIPGAEPENCIVVGDSLSADMQGAASEGIRSVWYNPERKNNPLSVPVTYEAASYADILELLTGKDL